MSTRLRYGTTDFQQNNNNLLNSFSISLIKPRSLDDRSIEIPFSENGNLRAHYTKTTVRAGEVLRLAAVFQDTRRAPVASGVSGVVSGAPEGKSSRSSERDQYAQCLDSHGHELFAPLSARGEFYATCQSGSLDTGSDAVLYRVHQLARRDLPLRVSFRRKKRIIHQ